jgi:FSR family fosmidomycin resistance protein-like MFS transporter
MTASTATKPSAQSTVFTVLFAVALCHGINDTMQAVLLSVYPLLRDNYALTFAQVGMITLVFQVTASILQPFVGTFTDKHPLPYAMPVAPLCTLAGLLLLAHAHSYPVILMAAGMIGIGSSIFHPDASRVTRLSSGGRYGFAQSTFQVGGNVGTAIGPLLTAAIVLPRGQGAISWFAVAACAAFLLLSYVGRWYAGWLREHARKSAAMKAQHALSNRQIGAALVVLMVLMFSKFVYTSSLHSFYSFYLIDHFGVTPQTAQIYLFVLFGAMALGTFAGGPIGDRIGTKAVIWGSILGALPFTLALPHTPACSGRWRLTVPIGLILSSAFSAMVVYAQELVPGRVGMISGLFFGLAFGCGGSGCGGAWHGGRPDQHRFRLQAVCSFLPALGLLAAFLPRTGQR